MKGLQGQLVEKSKSTLGRGETILEICQHPVFPRSMFNFCRIWSEIKAGFATLLPGSFSPECPSLWQPLRGAAGLPGSGTLGCRRDPRSPGLLQPHQGHWALGGSQWGLGPVASPICSLIIWGAGWQFCSSVSQRGFRK